MAFDSAIPRFESWRPSQTFSRKIQYLGVAAPFSGAVFMLRHVAKDSQAISTVAKVCRRLHVTWMQHGGILQAMQWSPIPFQPFPVAKACARKSCR
jgi:hypothetical protein